MMSSSASFSSLLASAGLAAAPSRPPGRETAERPAPVSAPTLVRLDKAQLQRFELKYLVPEATAQAIREYVRGYLVPDEFAADKPGYSYMTHTLYLDSEDLDLYLSAVGGDKNRFKLRIRYYEGDEAPVFFEIKRRMNECILKTRVPVRRDAVAALLRGEWPRIEHLARPSVKHLHDLQKFSTLMIKLHATPRSHVVYAREAWMSPHNNSVRLTFDRNVNCEPEFGVKLGTATGDAVTPFRSLAILELKFTERKPNWFNDLVRAFNLTQCGVAKYVMGVYTMGEHRVSNRDLGFTLATKPARHVVTVPQLVPAPAARAA